MFGGFPAERGCFCKFSGFSFLFFPFLSKMLSSTDAAIRIQNFWRVNCLFHEPETPLFVPYDGFHYHPHQEAGIRWMLDRESENSRFVRGGILADEMGLGKTWETVGLLLNAAKQNSNTLILVPPVLLSQWHQVLLKSRISHSVLVTGGQWKHYYQMRENFHVYLSTYDRIVNNPLALDDVCLERIIADEGHALRNPRTKRFERLSKIKAPIHWILSGTPVQNKMNDFKALCLWMGLQAKPDDASWKEVAERIILRRTVKDVIETVPEFPELPPEHKIVPVTMPEDSEEKKIFDVLMHRFKNAVDDQVNGIHILEMFLRIRQLLAHPQIYIDAMHKKYKGRYHRPRAWSGTASKMEAFSKLLESTEKLPTLIFTQFADEMNIAEDVAKMAGFTTFTIRGGQTDAQRNHMIEESKASVEAGKPTAVLIQIVAGNAGINLQHLNRIIFLSSHWNPAVVDQAVGRSYRIGQKSQVEVYHILLADGAERNLDRYMAKCHKKKRQTAKNLHAKLICEAAVSTEYVMHELNKVCPEEVIEVQPQPAA
jgi:SNF2 family DNA or RNA helicase